MLLLLLFQFHVLILVEQCLYHFPIRLLVNKLSPLALCVQSMLETLVGFTGVG